MPSSRSRKSMYEQLAAMDFAAKRLINSKGKPIQNAVAAGGQPPRRLRKVFV